MLEMDSDSHCDIEQSTPLVLDEESHESVPVEKFEPSENRIVKGFRYIWSEFKLLIIVFSAVLIATYVPFAMYIDKIPLSQHIPIGMKDNVATALVSAVSVYLLRTLF